MTFDLNDFVYDLPSDRIAAHPLPKRDQSKLLVYHQGQIRHERFNNLAENLPAKSLLVFNNTKVIPARLLFKKDTGADIEIFLLEPISPSPIVAVAMQAEGKAVWRCTIGNLKKWKPGIRLHKSAGGVEMTAELTDREKGVVTLSWTGEKYFASAIVKLGDVPLPPYIKRAADAEDRERYQTVYSRNDGAVAAPTAGLHFTEAVFESLRHRAIDTDYVTLHVSAGTFQPIKTESVRDHHMHSEQITVTLANISALLNNSTTIAVGTTSMRTLESLYWYGVKLIHDPEAPFRINQRDPYLNYPELPSAQKSLNTVADYMSRHSLDTITGETSIYILPGYDFRICRGLITNFHQPGSTLIVLVAAFIGQDWRRIYTEALENGYRFLSYGDSSLLLP
ncbi:S-adenosylmethionine:tRNA ribosyltransferase-isomerase [Chryseolinea sp. T2]|uniref:S-adenosylmethionine:tRNA ribosyltransferase-isomerase n=1 Tax=Chryseolinea sp. T2 TaxID=3129255 RepID=UPI0030769B3E